MTAREIRDMKKPKEIPYYDIPEQEEMLDLPGVVPEQTGQAVLKASDFTKEESIATSQENAEHDDCLERGAGPGQQEIPDAAEMWKNEEKCCENSSEPEWNTENEYDVRRKYCNAAARKLIHAYHDWMLEDFENQVMDVTASEEEYKQNFRKTGCSWYFSDPDAGMAHVNLFDGYVRFWSGTGEWIGDCRWFYLCAAIQTMWNEIALEQAKQSRETEESEESETEEIIDPEFEEEESVSDMDLLRDLLDRKKSLLESNLKISGIEPDDIHIRRQKLEIAALTSMLCELEDMEGEMEETEQPDLPVMTNDKARKEFIDGYQNWPLWLEQKETGERYYRYKFPEAAIVVKVYFCKCFDYYAANTSWEARFKDGWGDEEYYLLEDGKYFKDCRTNRSTLIDYLKELQKEGR